MFFFLLNKIIEINMNGISVNKLIVQVRATGYEAPQESNGTEAKLSSMVLYG
jgi:hypothetical protein